MIIVIIVLSIPLLFMLLGLIAEIKCSRKEEETWQNCQKCIASVLCSRRAKRPLTQEEANEIRKILSDKDKSEQNEHG